MFCGWLTAMRLISDFVSLVILVGSVISCLKSKHLDSDFKSHLSCLQSGSPRFTGRKQQLKSPQSTENFMVLSSSSVQNIVQLRHKILIILACMRYGRVDRKYQYFWYSNFEPECFK